MRIKFRYEKDKLVCNNITVNVVLMLMRLITNYLENRLSFNNLRLYNLLYGVDGRPNYILAGDGIFYLIDHSSNIPNPELGTSTDRFFWEVYNNPGPYQNNMNMEFLRSLASSSLEELKDSYNKYKRNSFIKKFIFG